MSTCGDPSTPLTLRAQTPSEPSPGSDPHPTSPHPWTKYLTFSPNQTLGIPTQSHSFYGTAGKAVDTVFPTSLHALLSLSHERGTSPLGHVSVTPDATRYLPEDPQDAPKQAPTPHSGLRAPAVPPTSPKLSISQTFPPESAGAPRCRQHTVLAQGAEERCCAPRGMRTHRAVRPAARPAPCQDAPRRVAPPAPRAAPIPRMRGGRAGCHARQNGACPPPHTPHRPRRGVGVCAPAERRGSPAWGMVMVSLALLEPTL